MKVFRAEGLLSPEENIRVQRLESAATEEEHTHEFIEIVYVASGTGYQQVAGSRYKVRKGTLLFINYGQSHSIQPDGTMVYYNILLHPEFVSQELLDSENAFQILTLTAFADFQEEIGETTSFIEFTGGKTLEMDAVARAMFQEFSDKALGYQTVLRGYLNILLTNVFRQMVALPEVTRRDQIMDEILDYIQRNSHETLTLTDLASRSFYNPSYFSRLFREYTGSTLTEYIHQQRIQQACQLLRDSTLSVEEIIQQVGYRQRKQFYMYFKRFTGTTPRQMREDVEP